MTTPIARSDELNGGLNAEDRTSVRKVAGHLPAVTGFVTLGFGGIARTVEETLEIQSAYVLFRRLPKLPAKQPFDKSK